MKYIVTVNGKKYEVEVEKIGGAQSAGTSLPKEAPSGSVRPPITSSKKTEPVGGSGSIKAPMPGTILDVKVTQGTTVKAGDVLFILEAMKMENEIVAEKSGVLSTLKVSKGDKVGSGEILAVIE